MKNNAPYIITGLGIILIAGILVYGNKKQYTPEPIQTVTPQATTTVATTTATTTKTTAQPAPSGITLAQVAQHNSKASCWSVINGNVYDLTSWIPNHPGGEKRIISICGIDGSSAYNGAHGDDSKPPRILAGFKLGLLAQ